MAEDQILKTYADAGYALTPLKGKVPTTKGWVATKFKADPVPEDFPENFGVVLQDDDLVVDCDPRNYKNNINSLQKLQADIKWSIKGTLTTVVRTGGGGLHIYMKKPADLAITNHHADYPGVEFKTKGSQVVGARCIHPESKMFYNIVQGCFAKPIPLAPQSLLDLITRTGKSGISTTPAESVVSADPQAKLRYEEYCKTTTSATQGENGDKTTYAVACHGRDLGLPEVDTFAILCKEYNPRCLPPWGMQEIRAKVKNAYSYAQNTPGNLHPAADFPVVPEAVGAPVVKDGLRWDVSEGGIMKRTLNNCVNHFRKEPLVNILAWDEFTDQVMLVAPPPWHPNEKIPIDGLPWTDEDTTLCRHFLSHEKKFDIQPSVVVEAVLVIAKKNPNHPVRNYLNNLKWDHVPRLDTWLVDNCGSPDSAYTSAVGVKTLLGAVARVFQPGVKFDYMLVLEGAQGTGKSSVVSVLGGAWYGDLVIDPHNKDTVAAMRGKWIVEASEMDFTTKAEAQAQKAFLSRQVDVVRFAYARLTKAVPRQCIIIGTMNLEADAGYLKDTTGNRRFWPVETEDINLPRLRDMRDHLFAEALFRYRKGESLYLDEREVEVMATDAQYARRVIDPWAERIAQWLDSDNMGAKRDVVSVMEIWVDCLNGLEKQLDRRNQFRIINVLRNELKWDPKLGWSPSLRKVAAGYKRTPSSYVPPKEEVPVV